MNAVILRAKHMNFVKLVWAIVGSWVTYTPNLGQLPDKGQNDMELDVKCAIKSEVQGFGRVYKYCNILNQSKQLLCFPDL